ncbi:hypothetical protein MMC18_004264 [Xylographa bjoerkii]|nr:hypothetical protein [Xylographa bjoerkii]
MASQYHNLSPLSPTKASLKSLPCEILLVIFCNLPDICSLKALILTCSSLFQAYRNSQSTVLKAVLSNQIPAYLLSDVTVVLNSSRVDPRMKEDVQQFLLHFSNNSIYLPIQWSLPDAVAIDNLYVQIPFFVDGFASHRLSIKSPPHSMPMSPTERRRIERTLYRFELYCNLFRECKYGDDHFSPAEQRDSFFARYTPWENEQLACVRDYLIERLSTGAEIPIAPPSGSIKVSWVMLTKLAFNDVAEHDIDWGEWEIPYVDDYDAPDNFHKEGYLSLGLSFLHRLVTAETYEQRYALISPALRSNDHFLFEGLQTQGEDDGQPISEYGNDVGQVDVDALLPGSEDLGPVRAWQWAHADSSLERCYFRDDQQFLRQSRYVMWDMSCGICQKSLVGSIRDGMLIRSFGLALMMARTNDFVRRCKNHGLKDRRSCGAEVGVGGVRKTRARSGGGPESSRK